MSACIQTKRLVLRPFGAEDGDRVVELLDNFEVARWLAKVPHPFTHADLRLLNDDGSDRWPDLAAITLDGAVIGGVSSGGHLGYWLDPAHWGKGFASEAAGAMVDCHFQSTDQDVLESGYFEGNDGSERILTKLGFTETARYPFFNKALNRKAPNVDMILTRDTWAARQ